MVFPSLVFLVWTASSTASNTIEVFSPSPHLEGDVLEISADSVEYSVGEKAELVAFGKKWATHILNGEPFDRYGLVAVPLGTRSGQHLLRHTMNGVTISSITLSVEGLPPIKISLKVPSMTKKTVAALGKENKVMKDVYAETTPERLWSGVFRLPCDGRMTEAFGVMRDYNKGEYSWRHLGVDYGLTKGAKPDIVAAQAGRIVLVKQMEAHGGTVAIDHGWGLYTTYLHLGKIYVKKGQSVKAGEVVGEMGASGIATGTHLHWGAKLLGTTVNPLSLLRLSLE